MQKRGLVIIGSIVSVNELLSGLHNALVKALVFFLGGEALNRLKVSATWGSGEGLLRLLFYRQNVLKLKKIYLCIYIECICLNILV